MRPIFLVLVTALRLAAAGPPPGHSSHGETFNEGPRQAAVLLDGCGRIVFPVTTRSSLAQKFFLQGVGQLHGFWYFEAERSFRQAAALDPGCAMAYWGCAMANVNNEKRALGFLAAATARKAGASPREQGWINALENYYRDLKKDKKQRHLDFIKDLEGLAHNDPEDLEARAFLAWEIWAAKDAGVPMVSREAVDALLMQLFAREPMHPARHYHIHLWDDQKPVRALASAALCGQTAPAIGHMWHMPGHTFSKTGRIHDAAWQQEAAIRVDHAYMIRTQVLPDQIHNYAHNAEWLVRTCTAQGRASDAAALARSLVEIPRHPAWNTLQKSKSTAAFGRARLMETLLKFELWEDVLQLEGSPFLDPTTEPGLEAARFQALGIAAFFKGDADKLRRQLAALEKLIPDAPPKPGAPQEAGGVKPASGSPPVADKSGPKPDIKLSIPRAELRAVLAIMEKKSPAEVQKLLEAAKDTPKERLVRYQMAAGNRDKALVLAGQLSDDAPGQALRMDVLDQCGRKEELLKHFEAVRKTAAMLDPGLPMGRRLDAIAAKIGCPPPWRRPEAPRSDSGTRPPLDSLGPVHWHPFPAAPFVLPDPANYPVALRAFAGKPVVVLFYLGHQCGHCVEQLRAFASAASDFKSAGLEIIAIGSEEPASLTAAAQACRPGKTGPAPLLFLADPDHQVFRQWRCYDDFENMPLHGAFLVDDQGLVRWMDVSHEPFMDVPFLLEESKRLFKFNPAPAAEVARR